MSLFLNLGLVLLTVVALGMLFYLFYAKGVQSQRALNELLEEEIGPPGSMVSKQKVCGPTEMSTLRFCIVVVNSFMVGFYLCHFLNKPITFFPMVVFVLSILSLIYISFMRFWLNKAIK